MSIWIDDKRLFRTVGANLAPHPLGPMPIELSFPRVQIIDGQCEVGAAVVRLDFRRTIPDQVEFLIVAEPEPGAGEVKGGTLDRRQPHHGSVKMDAAVDVGDVQGDMV